MTLRSAAAKREASRERGDIGPVGVTGETAVRQALGALLSERDEGLDVGAGRVGDRPDCGYGGIGEQLHGRVPASGGGLAGVAGKTHRLVSFACAERPPRQASEDT